MRLSCRTATLDMLVAFLQAGPRTTLPVMNQTGIQGTWDFDVNDQDLARTRGVSEVASIRPCQFVNPMDAGGATGQRTSPSGQITSGCQSVTMLIAEAWDLGTDTRAMGNVVIRATGPGVIASAPRSLEGKYFNVVAKSPVPLGLGGPLFRDPTYQTMLRNLLIERFRMATHYEDRVADVSTLVAPKPTFSRADPSSRSGCRSTGVAVGVPTTVTCRNVTMAQFVDELNNEFLIGAGRGGRRIVDATGLQGTWDLTFRYRVRPAIAPEPGQAPEPLVDLPPLQALEQQLGLKVVDDKRPIPAFVIDRIDEMPTEN